MPILRVWNISYIKFKHFMILKKFMLQGLYSFSNTFNCYDVKILIIANDILNRPLIETLINDHSESKQFIVISEQSFYFLLPPYGRCLNPLPICVIAFNSRLKKQSLSHRSASDINHTPSTHFHKLSLLLDRKMRTRRRPMREYRGVPP